MKKENGISLIEIILVVILILIVILWGLEYIKNYFNNQQDEDIKATMLAIQTVITSTKNKHIIDEESNILIGTKLDIENNQTEYKISDELKNILINIEDSNLYILSNEELINLGVKNANETSTEFYIVEYNSEDIIYSLGINGKYMLSDM